MLTIRLARYGKKKQPFYRLAVGRKQHTPTGPTIEFLGHYNPKSGEVKLETERLKYWLTQGAQYSRTVAMMLVKEGLLTKEQLPGKYQVTKNRKKRKEAKAEAEAKPATPVAETPATPAKEESKPAEEAQAKDESATPTA